MFTAGNDIGWHVFGECGSGFYHCHGSYSCSGVLDNARGEYRIVAYNAVAGNLGSVAEHAVIAHFSIVTNMCAFHEEVARLITTFSRMMLSSPMTSWLSSPTKLKSCGSAARTEHWWIVFLWPIRVPLRMLTKG